MELAGLDDRQFASYTKLRERFKAEERLLKILQQQAEVNRKQQIATQLAKLAPGSLLALKGKHIKVSAPLAAVFVATMSGSGQAPDYLCLGEDNRWYIAMTADVMDILSGSLPSDAIATIALPQLSDRQYGAWHKGDENTAKISEQISQFATTIPIAPEVIAQQQRIEAVEAELEKHPLQQRKNPTRLFKLQQRRLSLREQLHRSQLKYQRQQTHKSYYWQDFLNLIDILQEFSALDGLVPTSLGEAAATIRGENELWLGLAMISGELDELEPQHLAAAASALITEPLRPDTWTNYAPPLAVLEAFQQTQKRGISLREIRRQLYQVQAKHNLAIPVWLDVQLMGLVEQWVLGTEWNELCENTSLDEGDIVRLLRRTIDLLWQIPQIPRISSSLRNNAREAIALMKRFPI